MAISGHVGAARAAPPASALRGTGWGVPVGGGKGLGFRVKGLGFRVLGFRVSAFRV